MIESILRAHGLRTGMLTSPHLERVNERIVIDGEPISNAAFVSNWHDIRPFLDITDAELELSDQEPLSFFEALTLLAFAAFADAPVDVVVLEVGMGGEWDSTNVADGQVAVFTPIALDHTARLGNTIAEIARTKSGIIKPAAAVVSAAQAPEALAELERAAELTESTFAVAGTDFELASDTVAVGGQVITVKGLAGNLPRPVPAAVRRPPGRERRPRHRRGRVVHRRRNAAAQPGCARRGPRHRDVARAAPGRSATSRPCWWMRRTIRTAPQRSPRRSPSTSRSTTSPR